MIEKVKSALLVVLVAVSLVQSYFLAYSMPFMEANVGAELDYVKTEPLGDEEKVENLIFPEQIVVHMADDKHTVFFPGTRPYYELILTKLQGREFKGFQRDAIDAVDWERIRKEEKGVELRFGRAIPMELLQRVFKIEPDFLYAEDSIDRIWIYASEGRGEVRTFFFSSDGESVYESLRADLTIGDVEGYVGFGQYWDPYDTADGTVYYPTGPVDRLLELRVGFSRYTAAQMQDNLFFDPGITRALPEVQDGPKFYTDGKRGLKVEQGGVWMSYVDLVVPTDAENDFVDNIMEAIGFVNQHGGWNGRHQLVQELRAETDRVFRFQQYYSDVPIVPGASMNYGFMQLMLEQGVVSSYQRSLLVLGDDISRKTSRELPGGKALQDLLAGMEEGGTTVEALFPAYRPVLEEEAMVLRPVWAARLSHGEVVVLAESSLFAS